MRRKRCSRPSLTEPTSGRCNYDLEWSRNFFYSFSLFLCFPFLFYYPSDSSPATLLAFYREVAPRMEDVFPSVTTKLATKPCKYRCCIQFIRTLLLFERFYFYSFLVVVAELFDVCTSFLLFRATPGFSLHPRPRFGENFQLCSVRRSYRYWIAAFVIGEVDLI